MTNTERTFVERYLFEIAGSGRNPTGADISDAQRLWQQLEDIFKDDGYPKVARRAGYAGIGG